MASAEAGQFSDVSSNHTLKKNEGLKYLQYSSHYIYLTNIWTKQNVTWCLKRLNTIMISISLPFTNKKYKVNNGELIAKLLYYFKWVFVYSLPSSLIHGEKCSSLVFWVICNHNSNKESKANHTAQKYVNMNINGMDLEQYITIFVSWTIPELSLKLNSTQSSRQESIHVISKLSPAECWDSVRNPKSFSDFITIISLKLIFYIYYEHKFCQHHNSVLSVWGYVITFQWNNGLKHLENTVFLCYSLQTPDVVS